MLVSILPRSSVELMGYLEAGRARSSSEQACPEWYTDLKYSFRGKLGVSGHEGTHVHRQPGTEDC